MLEFEYARSYACPSVREVTVIREVNPWRERKLPKLTEKELASVPDNFHCYVCAEPRRKKDFGGFILQQRVCRTCYPWVDEQSIGGLIWWDERHGHSRFIREI